MVHYKNPERLEIYVRDPLATWNNRVSLAMSPWQIEEPNQVPARKQLFAGIGAAGGAAFGALAFLSWLRAFLLSRIRELSAAIRGK